MRALPGLVALLVVLVIVGLLVKRTMAVTHVPDAPVKAQAQQVQQQYKQAVEGALQARPEPDPATPATDGK